MKVQLPTRLAGVAGALLAVAGVLIQETHWSHELKQAITAALIAGAAWIVHPAEGGVVSSSASSSAGAEVLPPAGANQRPEPPPEGAGGAPL